MTKDEAREKGCIHGFGLGPACPDCIEERTAVGTNKRVFKVAGEIKFIPDAEQILTEKKYIAGRCPDCKMGPLVCRERKRNHIHGVCPYGMCLGCGFEGSMEDLEIK